MTKQLQFIEFVVENLLTLTEAYGKAEVEKLVKKFKDQAEALGILGKNKNPLTDDEIKAIINGFDQIHTTSASSIPVEKRDINKWKIKDLIKFVSEKINIGDEEEEEGDQTPDVIYDDPNYIIWNGSKEGNCIKYGKGEKNSYNNYDKPEFIMSTAFFVIFMLLAIGVGISMIPDSILAIKFPEMFTIQSMLPSK